MRRLPPLNAIRAFEAVARCGGIRPAMNELHVSQSAISRHISNLESHLQTQLFLRRGKRLLLTETGREYLQRIEPALDTIAQASTRAAQAYPKENLTISAPPSLLLNWLLPKLGSFLAEYPEYEFTWMDSITFPEEVHGIDCAIEYRIEPSSRLHSEPLLHDEIIAMASPDYVKEHNIRNLEDVRNCRLIETERRLVSWDDVLRPFLWGNVPRRLRVSMSLHALEATRLGYGIALANRLNASHAINAGELCIPFEINQESLPRRPQYFISTTRHTPVNRAVTRFIDWLKEAVQAEN